MVPEDKLNDEMFVTWLGPEIRECDDFLKTALDPHFKNSKLDAHFKAHQGQLYLIF